MAYTSQSAEVAIGQLNGEQGISIDKVEGLWVGREKERYDFVLKYLSGKSTSRGYAVHNFIDKYGNRFLAFLDIETLRVDAEDEVALHELVNGDCFTCKATVNRHSINNYKYGSQEPFKETVLNRMKFGKYIGRSE